ncbi:ATP-binding domain-containing protein [Prauserella cavernicola]|uniref:ATP-binding domain-containing protein n=1 Tax=Prauserella cavernicola TaxID=2800127 RepID=A0A934QXK9_9PSEU|nr:ATP-binding domain-containing protein [Prauserella cavernicola]MBK1788195.1 ATP-binding domain-containing protein [Prauserella cavernicola]
MSVSPNDGTDSAGKSAEIAAEQEYVSLLYGKLDAERELAERRLTEALRSGGSGPQAQAEREAATATHSDRLAQLSSVEQGLCFGRLDFSEGHDDDSPIYIGRLGLFDESDDYKPLLIDWRAPVSRPFYLATAASPDGVQRRRHIRTLTRRVVGVDDEILDLGSAGSSDHLGLAGEAALLAALEQRRTGAMSDIVATIQAEQDRIIRADLSGVMVVQGGPGTGKTAVALHRAAFLLYTYRRQLDTRGVLVVGPNSTFLRYIGQVLPSLGETGVLLSTVGELFPGLAATGADSPEAAEIKGRLAMVDVLTAAVRDRQTVPDEALEILVEGEVLTLDRGVCERAREKARGTLKPHNLARRVFLDRLLDALAEQSVQRLESVVLDNVPDIPLAEDESDDGDLLDARDLATIRQELAEDPTVLTALNGLWPKITPQELLSDLLTSPERLDSATRGHLADDERDVLLRLPGSLWTPADVPLLDELAELLGEDDTAIRARRAQREREDRAYAEGVLDILDQDEEIFDEERIRVSDVLDADLLAERQDAASGLTAAQRAAQDRTWTFGHVIVDEAQELSQMDWRILMRRCPSRSMTIVGDVSQTGSPAGTSSWGGVLDRYVADRWRLRELTVNYRTPAEIMNLAAGVLAEIDPELRAPTSVRETGEQPWQRPVPRADVAGEIRSIVDVELAGVEGGTVAVLVPADLEGSLSAELAGAGGTTAEDDNPRVSVLTVDRAKGLEFDAVVVVAPDEVVAESARGLNDLYVALTRATKRLGIVHTGPRMGALSGAENGR